MLKPTKARALVELLAAGAMWGFGFIAARWALTGLDPWWLCVLRFLIAGVVGGLWIALHPQLRSRLNMSQARHALLPALFLFLALAVQSVSLQYTTVTKCSFLTILYVLFVALLEVPLFKTKLKPAHFLTVVVALLGAALMCEFQLDSWNWGDTLATVCAVFSAAHILSITWYSERIESAFVFNWLQSTLTLPFSLLPALIFGNFPVFPLPALAWVGVGLLAVVSTLIAFLIQIRAQSVLSPTTVSIICLLESPFAAAYAFFLFHETLSWVQFIGTSLILLAATITILISRKSSISEI